MRDGAGGLAHMAHNLCRGVSMERWGGTALCTCVLAGPSPDVESFLMLAAPSLATTMAHTRGKYRTLG